MLPPSVTLWPSVSSRASRPATRTADGPISTPRRDAPRSSGTPMIRILRGGSDCTPLLIGPTTEPVTAAFSFASDSLIFDIHFLGTCLQLWPVILSVSKNLQSIEY